MLQNETMPNSSDGMEQWFSIILHGDWIYGGSFYI